MTTLSLDVAHDMLVTVKNNMGDPRIVASMNHTLHLIEVEIAEANEPLNEHEIKLPIKLQRIEAYRSRTGVRSTIAHAVVNIAWRKSRNLTQER